MTDASASDIEALRRAIRRLHGCDSSHIRSEAVHETFRGETAWDGVVEIFAVHGADGAEEAYAWSHETDAGGRRYVAVLKQGPIKSARDAVRAAIVAEGKNHS